MMWTGRMVSQSEATYEHAVWLKLYAATLANGKHTPEGAAKIADEGLRLYIDRFEILGKLERQNRSILEVLRVRSRQVDVGTRAMMMMTDFVAELDRRLQASPPDVPGLLRSVYLDDLRRRVLPQLRLHNGARWIIVPQECAPPKDGDSDHVLIRSEYER